MSVTKFLAAQESPRKEILTAIHNVISKADKKAEAGVGEMMGKQMIIYKCNGTMKYALASAKAHMSLHVLPMYGSLKIHATYKKLLSKAAFQKGCVNFKTADEMPLGIVKDLISDCAKVDLSIFLKKPSSERHASKKWMDYHKK